MSESEQDHKLDAPNQARRRFLTQIAAASGAALAPGMVLIKVAQARAQDQAVSSAVRWGMLIDTTKCARGCNVCVKACDVENGLTGHGRPETDSQWIRKVQLRDTQTGYVQSLPMLCQHCEYPPCEDVCPTGASFRRADGIVLVDKHICIGCRYCMMACPYKARSFVAEALDDQKPWSPRGIGTVESCTFCVHRVDRGHQPACVDACAQADHGAMVFGNLNDPSSEIAKLIAEYDSSEVRPDLGLNTGVRYRGL
ncbi:MAG: sulfate reduction electron transfer complex DsrMKJOP subunit DsrO [Gammaproteobacteria bacterium]|nr:4Fe-4S dicluster domain-containing protein [Gammaproteobacteria bacterium]